ncbi:hypothetical protein [Roseiconus lacunae]|uniref:Transmembrane protein n=2 Tax=Roseiconus lacunae TaxID=2605694 RepID=A0ABT7PJB9_9BACT|nr:hypothetical protein [Roseiconus lacunae]MDM4016570.1 hypothetical protein [Roseiconus lacunae]
MTTTTQTARRPNDEGPRHEGPPNKDQRNIDRVKTDPHGVADRAPEVDSPCLDAFDGWQNFELLPNDYRSMRDAKQLRLKWTLALALSLLLTGGSLLIVGVRQKNMQRQHDHLIVAVQPIEELRQHSERLALQTKRLNDWCRWVESSRPDDSLVQVIGALVVATQDPGNHRRPTAGIEAQSLSVKLPLHHSSSNHDARFTFVTSVDNPDEVDQWTERLRLSDRLENIRISSPSGSRTAPIIRVDADPIAAKPIP